MIASEEVQMVKDAVAGYLGTHYDFAARTATSRSDTGLREDIWRGLTQDLGLAGMALDDGGDLTAQLVVAEELGRALVIEPLIETCFLAAPLLQQCGGAAADALAQRIAAGDARVALAIEEPDMRSDLADIALTARQEGGQWHLNGTKSVVMTAPWADTIIVAARTAGAVGDAQGLSLFLVPSDTQGWRFLPIRRSTVAAPLTSFSPTPPCPPAR
jgi:alkylation response protein AidB-like acyl-CoA dehydrogenase